MTVKHIRVLVLVASVLLGAMSCRPATGVPGEKKAIVVTYSVLRSLVKELVGDEASVAVVIPNGADPHEWEPSAKDTEATNKADLVIENGLGLEAGMAKTLETARKRGVKFFTASDYVMVRRVGPGEGIPSGDPDQVVGAPDNHLWMDPAGMKSVVRALSTVLVKDFNLDVTGRASDLENRLDSLDKEIAATLASIPPENRKLVTGHESLGYFARRYGFKLVGVIVPSLSTQAEVSAADLAELKKAIQDNGVKVVFTELGTSPAVARAIGEATGAQVVEIKAAVLPGDGSYFTFMRDMAGAVASALK